MSVGVIGFGELLVDVLNRARSLLGTLYFGRKKTGFSWRKKEISGKRRAKGGKDAVIAG